MVILLVFIEVAPKVVDSGRQEGNLDTSAATILFVDLVLSNDLFAVDGHHVRASAGVYAAGEAPPRIFFRKRSSHLKYQDWVMLSTPILLVPVVNQGGPGSLHIELELLHQSRGGGKGPNLPEVSDELDSDFLPIDVPIEVQKV